MEALLDIDILVVICIVGFIAGFIDAIVGGGGMITIPTLLTLGLPAHIVLGTNKLAATFGSFTASLTFYKKKLFNPLFWREAMISTVIGAILGTICINFVSANFLEKILPILIVLTALYTLLIKMPIDNYNNLPIKTKKIKKQQIIQGLTLGFYDGFAGPGTGAFWTASSTLLYKTNILLSSGLARSGNFVSNFCSLLTFLYLGHVNVMLGLIMGFFLMIGSWVGAHSAIKFGGKFIRPLFIFVVLAMSINLAYKAWL